MQTEFVSTSNVAAKNGRFIYIAVPWTPVGGGMFKVADYLIQFQAHAGDGGKAILRPLDTRGGASAAWSLLVVLKALALLVRGRISGQLAGVHVNMAERLSVIRKGAIILTCRALGLPVVLHLHAGHLPQAYKVLPAIAQVMLRWLFSLPAAVVVLGRVSFDFVTRDLHVPADRVRIVINGVPRPMAARRIAGSGKLQRGLFVANLSERKGVSDLLRALAQPRFDSIPLEMTFAGGGDLARYRALASHLGLSGRVRFEGWANQETMANLLSCADVLVLPSYDEGLPLAILEALAHGVAVVCTPVGEIPHVLTDGVNACFVQPGDVHSIALGLHKVLGDSRFRETLERNGQVLYEQQFSLARFSASIASIHQHHFGISGGGLSQDAPALPRRAE